MSNTPIHRGSGAKWACLPALLMLIIAFFCIMATMARGWYSVLYSAGSKDYCQIPLWDCSLSACKDVTSYTGFQGAGAGCSGYTGAQVCFWIAALYALLYVWYMAGGFDCATIKGKWGTLDVNQCCLSTQCDVGAKAGLFKKCVKGKVFCGTPEGVLPHGCTFCVTPFFMLLGIVLVATQATPTEFQGIATDKRGRGWLFWFMIMMTLLAFVLCFCMMRYENSSGQGVPCMSASRGPGGAPTGETMAMRPAKGGGGVGLPSSAKAGFFFYTVSNPTPVACNSDADCKKHKKAGQFKAGTTFVSVAGGAWEPIQAKSDFRPLFS